MRFADRGNVDYLAAHKLNFDGLQIDLENRSVTTSNGTFELPPKEFDLLLYCAKHQGKILTKQQIYEEVWGEEYFYDDSNIMAIISRLRKKLEVNPSSPKYIQTVKGSAFGGQQPSVSLLIFFESLWIDRKLFN